MDLDNRRTVQGDGLGEQDLALLHGLQIAPRVSWVDAAEILGSTPATLAARWSRLRDRGLAWVTAHPGDLGSMVVSLVEVDCDPGSRHEVIEALCADPRAATVEESARGRDLLLTVLTADLTELTRFVLDDVSRVPGVRRTRTHLATALHRHGASWRLDALNRTQRESFEVLGAATRPQPGVSPPRDPWPLLEGLARDGRASAADLARVTGRNPATVRRQLPRLLASGIVAFRCEVAQVESQWPVSCTYVGRVPAQEHDRTAAALATLPELRLCVSTTGDSNLMFTVWVRSLDRLLRLEQLLGERLPWLGIVDSAVTLRTPKRMGWRLDDHGRATGEVVPPTALLPLGGRPRGGTGPEASPRLGA